MSTARRADLPASTERPTEVLPAAAPVPMRRSILHPTRAVGGAAAASQASPAPFDGWRDQVPTEEIPAVPATCPRSSSHSLARRTRARRHLRSALVGTLLAIVAITGLSAYAAAGITDARQAALDHAHISTSR